MDQLVKLRMYKDVLENASTFNEIAKICQEISFINIDFNLELMETTSLIQQINTMLWKYLFSTKLIVFHRIIVRAIFKLGIDPEKFGRSSRLHTKYASEYSSEIAATCLCSYGCFQSNYKMTKQFIYDVKILHEDFINCSLRYSMENSKYFAYVIENYIEAYDLKLVTSSDEFIITVIVTNLENSHKNIHKLLLELFNRVLLNADSRMQKEIEQIVLGQMSWVNRNKHYLLCQLITIKPEILLNQKNFNVKQFINGLRMGLSQYHLYSSSHSLVKVIYKRDPFHQELIKLCVEILLYGSDLEMKNFLRLWFTSLDNEFRNELFNVLISSYDFTKISSTSKDFLRAVIVQNAFERTFSSQIDNSIKAYCCCVGDDNVELKIEIFNFLVNEMYKPNELSVILENILRLLKFMQCNMCVVDSAFIDNLMRKLPNFFNFLATMRFRNLQVTNELFTIIRDDLYKHGIAYGTYESRVFSIRLLEIILKQYCGISRGRRLSKHTDSKINETFMIFLKENGIWDITSNDIFQQLERMAKDTENSDISAIANEIIVEYFIKSLNIDRIELSHGENFINWINIKVQETFNITDVESYHENISHCIMKFEYLNAKDSTGYLVKNEILQIINDLKFRSAELKISKDLVNEMERGRNLFALIDTINYSISKMDYTVAKEDIISFIPLISDIAYQFLDFVNDGISCPSFDVLDKNLQELVEKSNWKSENISDTKHKLSLIIFFTLRALSNLVETIVKLINGKAKPNENEYFTTISTCINVNIQILSRFCHKGSIESASQSLGAITKIISSEFLKQCDRESEGAKNLQKMLITLKHEIDCGKRKSSKTGEIRGSRGFLSMSHMILKNHPAFLKFIFAELLIVPEINSFFDTLEIRFANHIKPIHVHLIALLIKDSELVEEMLKYYDYILIATFKAYKESKDFIMQNALLQIVGSIKPKISNHKRHCIDEAEISHYEPKAISVYEYYVKFTYAYRVALYDLERNLNSLSQTYVIILLEIFSNFEYRRPLEFWSEMDKMKYIFESLLSHRCEKIRVLAAKCFAQWHLPDENMPKIIKDRVRYIFSDDLNLAHGSIVAVRHMIQRYEASVKFILKFDKEEFLQKPRKKILDCIKLGSALPRSFYVRYHLLDFLIFLGFKFNDDVIQMLMDESNITSKIGYCLWREKIKVYQNNAIKN